MIKRVLIISGLIVALGISVIAAYVLVSKQHEDDFCGIESIVPIEVLRQEEHFDAILFPALDPSNSSSLLYCSGYLFCKENFYRKSQQEKWDLRTTNPTLFEFEFSPSIQTPKEKLPACEIIEKEVFEQVVSKNEVRNSVSFWVKTSDNCQRTVQHYCDSHSIKIELQKDEELKQTYVVLSITTQRPNHPTN